MGAFNPTDASKFPSFKTIQNPSSSRGRETLLGPTNKISPHLISVFSLIYFSISSLYLLFLRPIHPVL